MTQMTQRQIETRLWKELSQDPAEVAGVKGAGLVRDGHGWKPFLIGEGEALNDKAPYRARTICSRLLREHTIDTE